MKVFWELNAFSLAGFREKQLYLQITAYFLAASMAKNEYYAYY